MKEIILDQELLIEFLLEFKTEEVNETKAVVIESPSDFQQSVENCLNWQITNDGTEKEIMVSVYPMFAVYNVSPFGELTVKLKGYFDKVVLEYLLRLILDNQ